MRGKRDWTDAWFAAAFFTILVWVVSDDRAVELGAITVAWGSFAYSSVKSLRNGWREPEPVPPAATRLLGRKFWDDDARGMLPAAIAMPCLFVILLTGWIAELTVGSLTEPFQIVITLPTLIGVPFCFLYLTTRWLGWPEFLIPPRLRERHQLVRPGD